MREEVRKVVEYLENLEVSKVEVKTFGKSSFSAKIKSLEEHDGNLRINLDGSENSHLDFFVTGDVNVDADGTVEVTYTSVGGRGNKEETLRLSA